MRRQIKMVAVTLAVVWGAFYSVNASAATFEIQKDDAAQSYSVVENGRTVLTYRFGEVPVPVGTEAPHFGKGPTDYDGAYFSDGSRFGGQRSDYIQPLYGFHGEELTADYPKDHYHHRGLWWSWCEIRKGEKIGDLWAVCKIRAYPVEMATVEATADHAVLTAVNDWRFDDEKDPIVRETATITVYPTAGDTPNRSQVVNVDIVLEALVDEISISGRQKVDYGGYGGMTVRLNGGIKDFHIRAVHPNPDQWRGFDLALAERVVEPEKLGDRAWMTLFGDYPTPDGGRTVTSLQMMENKANPLYPNNYRYYGSTCSSLAFPAKTFIPLEKGKPTVYKTRMVLFEGISTLDREKAAFDDYQRD